ncbi:MAG: LysR family transcriptional regulator [Pseudomonadota bacterium]|jgi:DNA-binding transcriptional LysR family regulator
MNLKRLQAFHAVFSTGSVTEAARRLHLSQPAVSRLIADLEHELGLSLFIRQRQRLVVTSEGRAFFREAERALAAVNQIADIARDIRTLQGAHLRVVAPMIVAFGLMPAVVKAFVGEHPKARVSLEVRHMDEIADWVTSGPFDAGITVMPFDDARIACERLATVRCLLALPRDHRLARKPHVRLNDLDGERMILPPPGNRNRDRYATALAAVGARYDGSIDTPSVLSACQLVAAGLGLAIVDPFTARAAAAPGLVVRPLRPAIELTFGLFFPANRPRSVMVRSFARAAQAAVLSASRER